MKKGFTLVELLAVIIVVSLVMTLTVVSITSSANTFRKKSFEVRKEQINKAAVMYGQDNYAKIINGNIDSVCNNYRNIGTQHQCTIKIKRLFYEYLEPDSEEEGKMFKNPLIDDEYQYFDDQNVVIIIDDRNHIRAGLELYDFEE